MTRQSIEGALRLFACFAIAFVVLRWIYPWKVHYGVFNVTWAQGLAPYAATAAIMTAVAGGAAFAARHLMRNARPLARLTTTAAVTYFFLVFLAVLFGPLGVDIPPFEIRPTLFTEYKFLTFMFLAAVIYAPVAACVLVWATGNRRVSPSLP